MNGAADIATKHVIVTGANGQLGQELQQYGHKLPGFEFHFFSKLEMDISNTVQTEKIFQQIKPAYCINCAAYTAVDKAETEKELAFLINSQAAANIAASCIAHHTRLVHISTDYVFDGKHDHPYDEETAVNPQTIYGASKAEGEERIMRSGADAIIIRTSWLYSTYGNNFVKTMLRLMDERTEIRVVNDQVGCPTYAADLATAIIGILGAGEEERWENGIYHYSNSGVASWYEFAVAIKEFAGKNCEILPITTAGYPTKAKRPAYSVLSTQKIVETFGVYVGNWRLSLEKCIGAMS